MIIKGFSQTHLINSTDCWTGAMFSERSVCHRVFSQLGLEEEHMYSPSVPFFSNIELWVCTEGNSVRKRKELEKRQEGLI